MSSRSVRLKNFKTYFLKLKSDIKLHVELTSGTIVASVYLLNGKMFSRKLVNGPQKNNKEVPVMSNIMFFLPLLWATRGSLQSQFPSCLMYYARLALCSQHSFGIPTRMKWLKRPHVWSPAFRSSITWNLHYTLR